MSPLRATSEIYIKDGIGRGPLITKTIHPIRSLHWLWLPKEPFRHPYQHVK